VIRPTAFFAMGVNSLPNPVVYNAKAKRPWQI
jgi:hypothetical protein